MLEVAKARRQTRPYAPPVLYQEDLFARHLLPLFRQLVAVQGAAILPVVHEAAVLVPVYPPASLCPRGASADQIWSPQPTLRAALAAVQVLHGQHLQKQRLRDRTGVGWQRMAIKTIMLRPMLLTSPKFRATRGLRQWQRLQLPLKQQRLLGRQCQMALPTAMVVPAFAEAAPQRCAPVVRLRAHREAPDAPRGISHEAIHGHTRHTLACRHLPKRSWNLICQNSQRASFRRSQVLEHRREIHKANLQHQRRVYQQVQVRPQPVLIARRPARHRRPGAGPDAMAVFVAMIVLAVAIRGSLPLLRQALFRKTGLLQLVPYWRLLPTQLLLTRLLLPQGRLRSHRPGHNPLPHKSRPCRPRGPALWTSELLAVVSFTAVRRAMDHRTPRHPRALHSWVRRLGAVAAARSATLAVATLLKLPRERTMWRAATRSLMVRSLV